MNGYNFDFAVSAKISPKVVEEMIKKVVEEQTGKRVASVKLEVKNVLKGQQMNEYNETVFEGATVFFENEKMKTGSKTFAKDTFDPHAR